MTEPVRFQVALDVALAGLAHLAAAREHELANGPTIPAPRPASAFCPTCGGTMRVPAWASLTERCRNQWHESRPTPDPTVGSDNVHGKDNHA